MNNIHNNSPYFTGTVDSSVRKYVTALKKESKEIYRESCKNSGREMNPVAFQVIEERCDSALKKLDRKAFFLHKDTVIKAMKNPRKSDNNLYLVAENKRLIQEWEQKGAIDTLSVYKNNLRETRSTDAGRYDGYITRFEYFADTLNEKTLDKKMVRTSISNLWNLSITKILKGKTAERYTESTKQVASDIGYENKTFPQSLAEHFSAIRERYNPKKENKTSFIDFIKELFTPKKKDKVSQGIRVI